VSSTRSVRARDIAARVEHFVRHEVIPRETDPRRDAHGAPAAELVEELRSLARRAGVLTPHILEDGAHLSQRETALVLERTGLSPLGPLACNTAAPDEGNMYLLGKVGSAEIKERFLVPLVQGRKRSAFFMTEPAADGGAGSDPSMMKTTALRDADGWSINGRKAFITGVVGAEIGIIMAKSAEGASLFIVDLPAPGLSIERIPRTIDTSMPGGHATVRIKNLRVPHEQMLGTSGEGFRLAQVRLSPARLSHCMRWLGACKRCQEIATDYANRREAFGKPLIEHEGVGFMLADNLIDLQQAELMIDWCAGVIDGGSLATVESSMTKIAVSEALMRVADRCVQAMGATGLSGDTIVEQVFRDIRAFRIYDGPSEAHRWSLAKHIRRRWREQEA
jgi:acyl-CoA dehydrogenase